MRCPSNGESLFNSLGVTIEEATNESGASLSEFQRRTNIAQTPHVLPEKMTTGDYLLLVYCCIKYIQRFLIVDYCIWYYYKNCLHDVHETVLVYIR